jgi:hypothetical protein
MKSKSLKITIEKARELYPNSCKEMQVIFEDTFGKDFWKVDITNKVKDLDSLIKHLGYDPIIYCKPNLTPYEKYLNACVIIAKVVEIYNEETILDWKNTSIYKYMPYKYFDGGSVGVRFYYWCFVLFGSSQHYYKSKDLAEKGYNNFKSYYEDYWNI